MDSNEEQRRFLSEHRSSLIPWSFETSSSEKAFYDYRRKSWSEGFDQMTPIPWTLLWLGIIARHWHALTYKSILRSFFHFIITIGPAYWPTILGKDRYVKYRDFFVSLAIISYSLHPGGGLYRDAIIYNAAERTNLDAAALFVRLIVGSRTLFWALLIFGYELPPLTGIPLNALCLVAIMRMKPSIPFCRSMQNSSTRELFQIIAQNLPLVSIIPLDRPSLPLETDICNPLVQWMQLSIGFLLPTTVQLCADYTARRAFAKLYPFALSVEDRKKWLDFRTSAFISVGSIGVILFLHASTALWYFMIWKKMQMESTGSGVS